MIRLRFFGPGELNQNGFSGAQYVRACVNMCGHVYVYVAVTVAVGVAVAVAGGCWNSFDGPEIQLGCPVFQVILYE